MEIFEAATRIVVCNDAAEQVRQLGLERLLVVSDPYFARSGQAQQLARAGTVEIFSEVEPDPGVVLAARGAALVQRFRPDAILALGGGSAMDCAKAMAFFSGLQPMLIAVPTTSGSGSEVTNFAILTHEGVKHPLVDDRLRPALAILDGSLLEALPSALIADGGFDLLSHALEAIAATGAGGITDALAGDAFCTALRLLPRSFSGEQGVRTDVHVAATMAGMAFSQAGLGICHALSHALGGAFHVPHGRLNAILLPWVLECNAPAAGEKYAALARRAGLSTGSGAVALRSLKNALLRLRRTLQLPESLLQAGISPEALREQEQTIVEAALADPCCASNPVAVTPQLVLQVLREAAGHE